MTNGQATIKIGDVVMVRDEPHIVTSVEDQNARVSLAARFRGRMVATDALVGKPLCRRCNGRGWVRYTDGENWACGCASVVTKREED